MIRIREDLDDQREREREGRRGRGRDFVGRALMIFNDKEVVQSDAWFL